MAALFVSAKRVSLHCLYVQMDLTGLRDIRKGKKITILQMVKITGINRNRISLIENGKVNPSLETVERIALALGCEIAIVLKR